VVEVSVATERASSGARGAFAGVFMSALLVFLGVGCVLPVLPRFVHGPLAAGDVWVGVVTGAFAFTAVVSRPIAGRLADTRGRRAVVIGGALLAAVAGALYFVPAGVPGLIVARLVLGAGEGAVFTAGATWVVDLAPEARRGQVIGLFGLAVWGALSAGPLIGEGLYALGGYHLVWAFAAVSPFLGALIASRQSGGQPAEEAGERGPLLPPHVVRPGIALALANVGYAALAGFIVLDLDRLGVGHGAGVFTAFAVAVVGTRLLLGRLPDRFGGRVSALVAGIAEAVGLALIALAGSLAVAVIGAIVMGMGFSTLFPSLALIVVNRSGQDRRGGALGLFTAFFDIGVGLGGPLMGAIAALGGYPAAFWGAAVCAGAGVLLTASIRQSSRSAQVLHSRVDTEPIVPPE
jgi:MFS family permease